MRGGEWRRGRLLARRHQLRDGATLLQRAPRRGNIGAVSQHRSRLAARASLNTDDEFAVFRFTLVRNSCAKLMLRDSCSR